MREQSSTVLTFLTRPTIAIGGATIIAVAAILAAWQMSMVTPSGQYVATAVAAIDGVGGTSSDLSFPLSGQIASTPVSIGQQVYAGTVLVALDRSSLLAARAGAVANLEAAQARLAALQAGTRPEQLAINKTAVAQAQIALANALASGDTNADDAIHAKADQVFTNPRNAAAQLTLLVPDSALVSRVQGERIALEPMLSSRASVGSVGDSESIVAQSQTNLKSIAAFLDDLAAALTESQPTGSISPATLVTYQASVNGARLNVLAALSGLTSADTAYKAALGALTLAQAGATPNDIAAQKAVVDATQAMLAGIDVSLRQSMLVAPFAGTITAMNAHLGQTVVPGQVLVSIESSGGSKQNALVVPKSSIIENNGQSFGYVKNGSGTSIKTLVTTGLVSADGMTEIVSGLSAGQEVLTFGIANK